MGLDVGLVQNTLDALPLSSRSLESQPGFGSTYRSALSSHGRPVECVGRDRVMKRPLGSRVGLVSNDHQRSDDAPEQA